MLRSMTGFGKNTAAIGGRTFSVELRSLNSKYLDLNLKIPAVLRDKEIDFRNLISEKVLRGKAELLIEIQSGDGLYSINRNAFKKYYSELDSLAKELKITGGNLVDSVMKIPDVLSAAGELMSAKDYSLLEKLVDKTIGTLDDFRMKEGKQLEQDIVKRIERIKKLTAEIKKIEGNRKGQTREKLKQKLSELVQSREVDEVRLEQELIFYSEKIDITEELVRLESHCNYFQEVVSDKEISKGKKLSFIGQEIGREINTLGAKANDASLQKFVVEMKEELEKIKEQVNNVL